MSFVSGVNDGVKNREKKKSFNMERSNGISPGRHRRNENACRAFDEAKGISEKRSIFEVFIRRLCHITEIIEMRYFCARWRRRHEKVFRVKERLSSSGFGVF